MRLRRADPNGSGWTRVRHGTGFSYRDADGELLDRSTIADLKSLAIPPAWTGVWICPQRNGHIQATGYDAAGRKQYLYHPQWREQRDRLKFDRVLEAASLLPTARATWTEHLSLEGMPRERATACAVRLLDLGYFRIGSDAYTDSNGSFGLTTLEKRHVRRSGDRLLFEFTGKSGVDHHVEIDDPLAIEAVEKMRRRRSGSERLMAYQDAHEWLDLDAADVNEYLRVGTGGDLTAKDFRTWHATVIAAVSLALTEEPGSSKRSRQRAVKQACVEVSDYLGNTPTMAKNSYIDPRVIDLYEDGVTIRAALEREYDSEVEKQVAVERAVCRIVSEDPDSVGGVCDPQTEAAA
ncbi:DNA topoisomerase IB [Nocardioidaceae bacterium]|nr:DNA topoisomerase IB [Nocardioidaceae bacterium]